MPWTTLHEHMETRMKVSTLFSLVFEGEYDMENDRKYGAETSPNLNTHQ